MLRVNVVEPKVNVPVTVRYKSGAAGVPAAVDELLPPQLNDTPPRETAQRRAIHKYRCCDSCEMLRSREDDVDSQMSESTWGPLSPCCVLCRVRRLTAPEGFPRGLKYLRRPFLSRTYFRRSRAKNSREVPGSDRNVFTFKVLVPGGGIEPPQGFWPLRILSPLRLPISPSRRPLYITDHRNITLVHSALTSRMESESVWMNVSPLKFFDCPSARKNLARMRLFSRDASGVQQKS